MKRAPKALDRIADIVLAYRPSDKKKKMAAKAKKVVRRNKTTQKRAKDRRTD